MIGRRHSRRTDEDGQSQKKEVLAGVETQYCTKRRKDDPVTHVQFEVRSVQGKWRLDTNVEEGVPAKSRREEWQERTGHAHHVCELRGGTEAVARKVEVIVKDQRKLRLQACESVKNIYSTEISVVFKTQVEQVGRHLGRLEKVTAHHGQPILVAVVDLVVGLDLLGRKGPRRKELLGSGSPST